MSQQYPISDFTQAVLSNLRGMTDANSIIGDPITTDEGVVIIPVSKVSFGYGAGGSDLPVQRPDLFGGVSGAGVTIQPIAFLVIGGGKVELLQIQSADNTADRIVNSIPAVLDKIKEMFPKKDKDEPKA